MPSLLRFCLLLLCAMCLGAGEVDRVLHRGIHVGEVAYTQPAAFFPDADHYCHFVRGVGNYQHRLVCNRGQPGAAALRAGALESLGQMEGLSLVVTEYDLPTEHDGILLMLGAAVDPAITRRLVALVQQANPGPIHLCPSVDKRDETVVVIGSSHAPRHVPASAELLAAVADPNRTASEIHRLLSQQELLPHLHSARQPYPLLPAGLVAAWDFTSGLADRTGQGGDFAVQGRAESWQEGLFLSWKGSPYKDSRDHRRDFPDAYQARAALPGLDHQALSITMLYAPAMLGRRRDLLFNLGWRWRVCGAFVDDQGRIGVSFNNGADVLLPALAKGGDEAADIVARRWQAVSITYDLASGKAQAYVDGKLRRDWQLPRNFSLAILDSEHLRLESDIGFVDMGSLRRMQGVVAQLRVDNGALSPETVADVHRHLLAAAPPLPDHPAFTEAPPVFDTPRWARPDGHGDSPSGSPATEAAEEPPKGVGPDEF